MATNIVWPVLKLKFTPLEFETPISWKNQSQEIVKIYSVGVWNFHDFKLHILSRWLKFTPLEFETIFYGRWPCDLSLLKFTPLEFETKVDRGACDSFLG